jgi:hypothetical protein
MYFLFHDENPRWFGANEGTCSYSTARPICDRGLGTRRWRSLPTRGSGSSGGGRARTYFSAATNDSARALSKAQPARPIQGAMGSHPLTSCRKRARCVLDATMVARGAGSRARRDKDDLRRDGVSVRRAVSLGLTLRYAIPRALTLVSGPMNATLVNFCSLGPSSSCPYLPKLVELDFR